MNAANKTTSPPQLINRRTLAKMLDRSPESITMAATRRDTRVIPMPVLIGGRYYWELEAVHTWIQDKIKTCTVEPAAPQKRGPGRPRKGEGRAFAQAQDAQPQQAGA